MIQGQIGINSHKIGVTPIQMNSTNTQNSGTGEPSYDNGRSLP